jgi:2-hydroxy-4-(methylsulfanyl)butanoate S-methyltransferase
VFTQATAFQLQWQDAMSINWHDVSRCLTLPSFGNPVFSFPEYQFSEMVGELIFAARPNKVRFQAQSSNGVGAPCCAAAPDVYVLCQITKTERREDNTLAQDTVTTSDKAIESAEDLSSIAFGFMASKALFAGLHVDIFSVLADGPKSAEELAKAADIPINRIVILTTALASVGLLTISDDKKIQNSPAAQSFLSKQSKYDFGDYLRYQIDQQMYPFLLQLNAVMKGNLSEDAIASYRHWMTDEEQASVYSESQHAGSLGPGRTLARKVDLSNATTLLDVGGGTGAMTISLCTEYENLQATIIDFPNVAEIGWRFISEAGLVDRVRYIPGNAIEVQWPGNQHAILMSYLMSGVPGDDVEGLLQKAFEALSPGGKLMVHDFMVEEDRRGPALAALWQLQHMAFTPEARSLSVGWLTETGRKIGFTVDDVDNLIPAMTKLVVFAKPS